LTLYNRNSSGRSQSVTVTRSTEVWNAPKYVLGRLLVEAGVGEGFFNGDIAEVVVCIGAVSSDKCLAVENYLAATYLGLPYLYPHSSDFRYTGHYYHEKSDLHLAPYRAYDSVTGRWISEDPIQEAGGINLYGYVQNKPLVAIDELGLQTSVQTPAGTATLTTLAQYGMLDEAAGLAAAATMAADIERKKAQAQERAAYKKRCTEPNPKNLDPCATARWKLQRNKDCLRMRQEYSNKWYDAPDPSHQKEIDNLKIAIQALEEFIKINCPN